MSLADAVHFLTRKKYSECADRTLFTRPGTVDEVGMGWDEPPERGGT
jgi:hypothetical protein